jgi:RNA polymerase sigma factor (TIGR02999 family)
VGQQVSEDSREITRFLRAYGRGETGAGEKLVELVYSDLRRVARNQLRRGRPGQTLNTTGLVHETYLKLLGREALQWNDRRHFFAVSSRAMRQIVVDYARHKRRQKRGGGHDPVPLDGREIAVAEQASELVELDEALEKLAQVSQRLVQVVECRFFAGLTARETAETLGTSLRTVERDWTRARAWLRQALQP